MIPHLFSHAAWQASRSALLTHLYRANTDLARAAMLERLADTEMQQGHHEAGERLSHLAQELRARAQGVQP